jgi:hypothetical protein
MTEYPLADLELRVNNWILAEIDKPDCNHLAISLMAEVLARLQKIGLIEPPGEFSEVADGD